MARLIAFSRLLVRTVGDPALRRLIPVYCGLAVLIGILFGPAGMSSEQVLRGMAVSPRFRIGVWIGWLVLVAAPTRSLFHNRDALYLRSMPIWPVAHWLLLGAMAVLIQLPWTWLWWRGAGSSVAVVTTITAACLCTVAAVTGRDWLERLFIGGVIAGLLTLIATAVPYWQLGTASAVLFVIAVRVAWTRAPERGRRVDLAHLSTSRSGLVVVYFASVWRCHRSSLARGLVLAAVGGALAALIARNNQITGSAGITLLALVFATIMVTLAVAMIVGPVVQAEREMRWMLACTGTSAVRRVVASAVLCSLAALIYAAVFVTMIIWIAPITVTASARMAATVLPLAVAIGLIELRCARWAERSTGVDGARLVYASVIVIVTGVALFGMLNEWALVVVYASAAKVTLGSAEHTLVMPARKQLHQ